MLTIRLGDKGDLAWAQAVVRERHYLQQRVDPRARPMVYVVDLTPNPSPKMRGGQEGRGEQVGLLMVSIPHATRCRGWWGYDGLPTQWQVVDLCRVWLDPRIQAGGEWCKSEVVPGFVDRRGVWRPAVATWAMGEVLARVQRDRISLWPPVFPAEPYHIRLAISYHDPQYHQGTVYRQMGWLPMYFEVSPVIREFFTHEAAAVVGTPISGPSGKFGWCWPLPEPEWSWDQIRILRPRTMRLWTSPLAHLLGGEGRGEPA